MECSFCGEILRSRMHYGMHNLSYHSDSWAVIDLLEAGVSENDANKYYDRCMKQEGKKLGRKMGSRRRKRNNDALSMNTEHGFGHYPKYDTEIPQFAFSVTSNILVDSDIKTEVLSYEQTLNNVISLTDLKFEEMSPVLNRENLETISSELKIELGLATSEQQTNKLTSPLPDEIKPGLSEENSDENLFDASEASDLNVDDEDGLIADEELKGLMSEIDEILWRKRPNAQ